MTAATLQADRGASWAAQLARYAERARAPRRLVVEGRLTRMVGLTIEAVGCQVAIGGRCLIAAPDGREIEAEVVGFAGERLFLMPVGDIGGLSPQCRVIPTQAASQAAVGEALLGRVVDASGRPLDGAGRLRLDAHAPLAGRHINPLARAPVDEPLDVGVRAVNALLTMGRGQRMGLFAGSGVGKSVLLGMMTRYTNADVVVVALIGERGREVGDFVHKTLGPTAMARSVVVASPADCPPLMRVHGAMLATTIAEHFRDRGYKVLLLMDSLTRYAQAQREIGLAIGEAPATKGYPPSAFARLPQLVERAGCADTTGAGSISAIYTVLTEGDDPDDPIADAARAILDGHIVLSRRLAEAGHYPAIDIEASVSRVMSDVAAPASIAAARRFKQIYSTYQQHRDLINVGAYQRGSDSRVDEAIERYPALERFLQQDMGNAVTLEDSATQLQALTGAKPQAGG